MLVLLLFSSFSSNFHLNHSFYYPSNKKNTPLSSIPTTIIYIRYLNNYLKIKTKPIIIGCFYIKMERLHDPNRD